MGSGTGESQLAAVLRLIDPADYVTHMGMTAGVRRPRLLSLFMIIHKQLINLDIKIINIHFLNLRNC